MQSNLNCSSVWFLSLLAVGAALGQTPDIQNGDIRMVLQNGGLAKAVDQLASQAADAAWIGYSTLRVDGRSSIYCNDQESCCGVCSLDGDRSDTSNRSPAEPIRLEPAGRINVLLRAEAGEINKLRVFSADCKLDAGGRTVHWLGDVESDSSVTYLSRLVDNDATTLAKHAVMAIAYHKGVRAVRELKAFAKDSRPLTIRKKAAFWLGAARGQEGFEALRELMRTESNPEFRKHAVFAVQVSEAAEAVDELIRLARRDDSSVVRKAALFWLSRKAGEKAARAISGAARDDPETEVKKRAVFALSRLPAGEGIPLLIEVARSNANPEVRKKAMFWLGQTNAPTALDFFEDVLK